MASENVRVSVRIRPPMQNDTVTPVCAAVHATSDGDLPNTVSTCDPATGEKRRFAFDAAFTEHDSNQKLYSVVGSELLEASLAGLNVTLLAYGQTGSGKTHTMFGDGQSHSHARHSQGLVPLLIKELTSRLGSGGRAEMSMIEVYNETPRDLLCEPSAPDEQQQAQVQSQQGAVLQQQAAAPQQQQLAAGAMSGVPQPSPLAAQAQPQSHNQKPLKIREDPIDGPYAEGLTWHEVPKWDAASALLERGNAAKAMGANDVHAKSSRSHTLVQVRVQVPERDAATGAQRTLRSQINLVDLAGSERAAAAGSRYPQTAIEGKYINKSLSALGNCVRALADKRRDGHVPFRDSVLTWLLKNSLAGNARTAVIANVSPAAGDYTHTLGSIRFVDKMQRIETAAVVNEDRKPLLERGNNAVADGRRRAGAGRYAQPSERYHGVGGRWVRGKGFVKAAMTPAGENCAYDENEHAYRYSSKRQRLDDEEEAKFVRALPESPVKPTAEFKQRPRSRDGWVEEKNERGRVLKNHAAAMRQNRLRNSAGTGVQYLRQLEEEILQSISTTSLPTVKEPASEQFRMLGLELAPPSHDTPQQEQHQQPQRQQHLQQHHNQKPQQQQPQRQPVLQQKQGIRGAYVHSRNNRMPHALHGQAPIRPQVLKGF